MRIIDIAKNENYIKIFDNSIINNLNILYNNLTDLLGKSTTSKECSHIIYALNTVIILTLEKLKHGEDSAQFKEMQQKIGVTKEQINQILSLLKKTNFIKYTSNENQMLPKKITFHKNEIEYFIYINS